MRKRRVKILFSAVSKEDLQNKILSFEKDGWERKSKEIIYDEKSRRWFFVMFLLS